MQYSIRKLLGASALAVIVFGVSFANAQGPKHKPNKGRGHKNAVSASSVEAGRYFSSSARQSVQSYYANKSCPPGLAKKRNGCLPPGQAKKRYQVGHALDDGLRIEPAPRDIIVRIPTPPVGHIYGEVDGDILLIAETTRLVVDAIDILTRN